MITEQQRHIVGRVLRASTTGFDCGTRASRIDSRHTFGSFVKVPVSDDGSAWAIGLIYAIRIDDDPLARELVMASSMDTSALMDQRDNRMVPVEICVVNIGYMYGDEMVQRLPPLPPMSLSEVELCDTDEIRRFTQRTDYLRLVLNAREVPVDQLLVSALRYASFAYEEQERYPFMVRNGRQLANLLSYDLKRLSHLLEQIKP